MISLIILSALIFSVLPDNYALGGSSFYFLQYVWIFVLNNARTDIGEMQRYIIFWSSIYAKTDGSRGINRCYGSSVLWRRGRYSNAFQNPAGAHALLVPQLSQKLNGLNITDLQVLFVKINMTFRFMVASASAHQTMPVRAARSWAALTRARCNHYYETALNKSNLTSLQIK